VTTAHRAALLLRVSTDRQTPENQRAALERMAAVRGLEVVEVYEEVVSGASIRRDVLDEVLAAAHRGEFSVLLVWALDRLSRRGVLHTLGVIDDLARRGVRVLSASEPWTDVDGPVRELLVSIFAWVARQERERLRERVLAGLDRARREGKRIGRPKRLVRLDEDRALRLVSEGLSVRAVARQLGVPVSTAQRALRRARARAETPGA